MNVPTNVVIIIYLLYTYHFSTVVDFSSEKYSGSTVLLSSHIFILLWKFYVTEMDKVSF